MITIMQVIRRNKLKCLLLLLSLAFLSGVVALATSSDDSTAEQQHAIPQVPNPAGRTYALLAGIPQHGSTLGHRKAPVTLQFFGDLQCEESRHVMLGALPFLIRHWVRAGKLQIRFRSMETDTKGAGGWYEFREQQGAALAAGEQGKLWNFISVFYREQSPELPGNVDQEFLEEIAVKAGLDLERWQEARQLSERWVTQIDDDEDLGYANGLRITPSFGIGPTGGQMKPLRHFSLGETRVFDEAIRGLL